MLSLLSTGIGFLTGANLTRLVQVAGQEARATIGEGGIETRASIVKAEEAAKEVLGEARRSASATIQHAQRSSEQILIQANREISDILNKTGIETRHSAEIVRIQSQAVLQKAGVEVDKALRTAGFQSRETLMQGGVEAQKVCVALGKEFKEGIQEASQETQVIIAKAESTVKAIFQTLDSTLAVTQNRFTEDSIRLIEKGVVESKSAILQISQDFETKVDHILTKAEKVAQGVIIQLGNEGRLLIQDTGREVRMIANDVLTQAHAHQEMVLKVAGEEMRLTLNAAGEVLRSRVHEMPFLAGLTAELVGRNFAFGLRDGFWRTSQREAIINKIKNLVAQPQGVSIEQLLNFVLEQTQIPGNEKAELYKALIGLCNEPNRENRELCFILIGITVLEDDDLKVPSIGFLGPYIKDYSADVIEQIPGAASEKLREKGVEALKDYLPTSSPLEVEEPLVWNVLEQELEAKKEELSSLEGYVQTLEQRVKSVSLAQLTQAELLAEKEGLIEELKKRVEVLQTSQQKLEENLATLTQEAKNTKTELLEYLAGFRNA